MKFQASTILLGLAASAVQAVTETGPFYLHITGTEDSSIDGYAVACHAGAAIEGFCYAEGPLPEAPSTVYEYYFNDTTASIDAGPTGILSWKLNVDLGNGTQAIPQTLQFQFQTNSNVARPMFQFPAEYGVTDAAVGFDDEDKLFSYTWLDDANNTPETPVYDGGNLPYYNWNVCYQYMGSYYYQSVGWVQSLPPHNPTCTPVNITMEMA